MLAVRLVSAVIDDGNAFDDAIARHFASDYAHGMEARDKGLARLIAATVLRRKGELDAVIAQFIERPLPADRGLLSLILAAAAAQLLVIGMAPHAVINVAVEQCRRDRGARRFDKLANAVLRRISERGAAILETAGGPALDVPDWMFERWTRAYGPELARDITLASLAEAPLDISVKSDAPQWAERLGGIVLPTGSIRMTAGGFVEDLPGYAEGAWWIQDAAAALPARLLGDVAGKEIADLCAAPGGKTAELATAGARVTAVELSADRMERLSENLTRLGLSAETIVTDLAQWQPQRTFDAVLLDVPCTATGTIRRHPDIIHLKRHEDHRRLARLQGELLDAALRLVRPGGLLVYCSCSLEPEEGTDQIAAALARHPEFARRPIAPGEAAIDERWLNGDGDLRTLPCHQPGEGIAGGMDGFFAARLVRQS